MADLRSVDSQAGLGADDTLSGRFFIVPKSELSYDICALVTAQGFHSEVTMLPVQSRMARAAVGWGVRDLASAAKVSPDTVARLERGESLAPRTLEAIRSALEAGGVEFIEANGGGPGVRLQKTVGKKRDNR